MGKGRYRRIRETFDALVRLGDPSSPQAGEVAIDIRDSSIWMYDGNDWIPASSRDQATHVDEAYLYRRKM